jgi:hypothetical protein
MSERALMPQPSEGDSPAPFGKALEAQYMERSIFYTLSALWP